LHKLTSLSINSVFPVYSDIFTSSFYRCCVKMTNIV